MRIKCEAFVALVALVSFSYLVLSLSDSASASSTLSGIHRATNAPDANPTAANLQFDCRGSGELSGAHPGWSSDTAIKLKRVDLSPRRHVFYWCPAAAPSGQGQISYTLTSFLGAITCETTRTSCEMDGVPAGLNFQIMATDQTQSYPLPTPAIQNSGTPLPCTAASGYCNLGPGNLTFPSYGNVGPGALGDCTFAAVANWEEIVLGTIPDPSLIQSEFSDAGGTSNLGLTNSQVFSYWRDHGIAGVFLNTALPLSTDPIQLMNTLGDPSVKGVIASINLSKGQNFAGYTMPEASYHWVVVDGYTPQGPLVATWGKTLQVTWQQWNLEIVSMWGITTRP